MNKLAIATNLSKEAFPTFPPFFIFIFLLTCTYLIYLIVLENHLPYSLGSLKIFIVIIIIIIIIINKPSRMKRTKKNRASMRAKMLGGHKNRTEDYPKKTYDFHHDYMIIIPTKGSEGGIK